MAAGMATSAGTSKAFDYGDVALGWAKNKMAKTRPNTIKITPEIKRRIINQANSKAMEIYTTQGKKAAGPCLSTVYDPLIDSLNKDLDALYYGHN